MAEASNRDCSIPSFMQETEFKAPKLTAHTIEIPIPSLKDKYVVVIPNAFSEKECKELIDLSENIGYKDALVNLGFGHTETMNEFRNHKKLSFDNPKIADYIFNRIKSVIPKQFDNRKMVDINERLRFLRYSPSQYFGAHYDGMYMRKNGQRSLITIVIYLNDNYNGGEITFLHPTNENKTHSIKPQTGMVLLFEQKELFHEGSIVLNINENENDEHIFKYCIRSDIMYSSQRIAESKSNHDQTFTSYEVEKQTVYFQRKQAIKSIQSQPNINGKKAKMNKLFEESLTVKVINFWLFEEGILITFPNELYEEIAKYCRIIGVLDFICDPNELERLAQVCESAERYEETVELITELVKLNSRSFKCCHNDEKSACEILTKHQRNLLSVSFKNVVGEKRASWRTICSEITSLTQGKKKEYAVVTKAFADEKSKKMKLYICNQYLKIIERELHEICLKLLDLLENYIINKIKHCTMQDYETLVFYLKMVGDYNRYLAEIFDNTTIYKEKASEYYNNALKIGKDKLKSVNPTLLGLSLNYSVHLYEIAHEAAKACEIAKTAFDNAINKLDTMRDDEYKDATLIMRLLRDNLTLWTSENDYNQQ